MAELLESVVNVAKKDEDKTLARDQAKENPSWPFDGHDEEPSEHPLLKADDTQQGGSGKSAPAEQNK
ncbi:uncharacterized protein ColSpa_11421 [Colletotrichum spaethianum]|uniref:Uncharacterized protein n=1 Tax=Colletotrichum spaethianum TaxID=700344 RepID=A0AA37UPQ7_9PEZI|nr:uncharacterized protein ColSpa_11421 [Colletotrichum spaethianum]GKT51240.1 hypothetical protein ColSpa_11421 [Colletotrichum spaethianum]